jgi:hypothetical protein
LKGSNSLVWLMSGMSGWMMIGNSWALPAILAIPEAIRRAQTSCARSRPCGRRRATAHVCRRRTIPSKPGVTQHGLPPTRCPNGQTALPAPDRTAGSRVVPVGAPQAIPPHIPFARGPIPQSALRNRPAAVRRSGIRNRWREARGWRLCVRCC